MLTRQTPVNPGTMNFVIMTDVYYEVGNTPDLLHAPAAFAYAQELSTCVPYIGAGHKETYMAGSVQRLRFRDHTGRTLTCSHFRIETGDAMPNCPHIHEIEDDAPDETTHQSGTHNEGL